MPDIPVKNLENPAQRPPERAADSATRSTRPDLARFGDGRFAETNPHINSLFQQLGDLRGKLSPEDFHKLLSKLEKEVFPALAPFGFKGCRTTPEGTLKEFGAAYDKWNSIRKETGGRPTADVPSVPSEAYRKLEAEIRMWKTAAEDPIAALVIGGGYLTSETVGKKLGFEQDPVKAAASGKTASELAKIADALNVAIKAVSGRDLGVEENAGKADLSHAETEVVKEAIGASGRMTDRQKGVGAELSAAWILHSRGHVILGAIQNSRNNGLDLATAYKGNYYVWEVKANRANFSHDQRDPAQFVVTRVYDALPGTRGGAGFDQRAQDLAHKLSEAAGDNRLQYGTFRVRFKE